MAEWQNGRMEEWQNGRMGEGQGERRSCSFDRGYDCNCGTGSSEKVTIEVLTRWFGASGGGKALIVIQRRDLAYCSCEVLMSYLK